MSTSDAAKDVHMSGQVDPIHEMTALLKDDKTPVLLRKALELFMAAGPEIARDAADKLDELCERRLAFQEREQKLAEAHSLVGSTKQLELNERCDALTGRLMKYLGKLVVENERTGGAQLVLFAAARSFICTSAIALGAEDGISGARLIFEETLQELAPMLRDMPETVIE